MTKVELGQHYEKYRDSLLSSAMFHLKDRDWAEDVLHDSFEYMLKNRGLYDPDKGKPLTWMAIVVNRRCLNALRDRATELERLANGPRSADRAPSPEDDLIEEEQAASDMALAERLEAWLTEKDPEVSDDVRFAINAHYVGGRELQDIAEEQGVSRFTLYRKITKALNIYRRRFRDGKVK